MGNTQKGHSTTILVTALLLNISFILLWINDGNLSYENISQPSLWGWTIVVSILFSSLSSISKHGVTIAIILLYLYALFLMANLMYYGVFNIQIPLNAFGMIGNLYNFTDSVMDTFSAKLIIPLLIVTAGWINILCFRDIRFRVDNHISTLVSIVILIVTFNTPESFRKTYGILRLTHHENSATTILFSPFTNLIFQYLEKSKSDIDSTRGKIDTLIASNMSNLVDRSNNRKYDALVIILIESLESFVIGL